MSDYGCIFVRGNNLGNNWGWRSISKWYISNFSQLIAFSAFLGSISFVFSAQLQTPVARENALLFLQQSSKNVSSRFDIQYYKQCFVRKPEWYYVCSRHHFGESCLFLNTHVLLLIFWRKMCCRKSIGRPSVAWAWGLIFKQLLRFVRCERQSLYKDSLMCAFSFVAWSGQRGVGDKAPLDFIGGRWQFRSSLEVLGKIFRWFQRVDQDRPTFGLVI